MEKDDINLVGKSSDAKSHIKNILLRHTPLDGLLANVSLSFLREVRFIKQVFLASTLIFNIKYNLLGLQNNNPFYRFHD